MAGARPAHQGHHGLHGRLPRRRQAAPRIGGRPCGEEAGGDRQGRPHPHRCAGSGFTHGRAGRKRRRLRQHFSRVRRASGSRRGRVLRHRRRCQYCEPAAGPVGRPVHLVWWRGCADGRRSRRRRARFAPHAAGRAGPDPQLGAVCRAGQPCRYHRAGHQRPEPDGTHRALDAGRGALRQLGRLLCRRRHVRHVLAGARIAGDESAPGLPRQIAGHQHLA